ncbi:toll-like receptor 7 isoform X1 [Acipenser oxyrinchus oxyrinchus]|uniref:Toll-like receptor 7 isoform X1 n=1 Tax=Acipenser oxyrinchus oxyrinchus TaxID=40147 RepID=A0AAD8G8R6_ACIOX|nr:toll-like receptor 7 isoform X1 [Acipenser oxyrinchus oxyrinchus]
MFLSFQIFWNNSLSWMTCILFFCYSASILTADSWYPKSLPCDVSVERNGTTVLVECNERRLTEVPKGFPANATNLTLTINHIPNIYKMSFAGLENLTEIDFRCNCVPVKIGPKDHVCTKSLHVEDGSFSSLTNLRSLYLDGNQLSEIPKGLPPNLLLLSLEVNKFSAISKENLSELTNIEELYLGQNCYYRNPCNVSFDIQYGAFYDLKNLALLSLKSNNLSKVPQNLPPSLKELYLYNNRIQHIDKYDFINLTKLEILDLSGNCPRCYNAPFPCTPCPNNAQINIDLLAFDMLKDLKILRLHSNSLETVPYQWFQHTGMLKILDLSSNYLAKEIERAQFVTHLSKLEEIDLSFNFELQQYLPFLSLSETFCNLTSLRVLRIRGYVFRELSEAAFEPLKKLKQLEIIDLGTNFIKLANLSILRELQAFQIINLSDNKISPYSNDSPYVSRSCSTANTTRAPLGSRTQFYNGEVRDIHYFRYDEYARSCKSKDKEAGSLHPIVNKDCSRFGKTLDLSRNNIFFINPTEFKHLGDLRCLNLSGNAMSQSLNGSEFSYLSELEYLDFSNNRIDLLYSTAFQELKNLKVLDLSHNNFYFLSEGITHMLNFTKNLPKLQTLLLNYNKISTSTNTVMESHSLEILEFKGNRLDILWRDGDTRYSYYFRNLSNLVQLDISHNSLNFIPQLVFKGMPSKLRELYLNNNKLTSFNWGKLQLLTHLQVLDLSNNKLKTVPRVLSNCTKTLTKLILHKNQIPKLTQYFLEDAFSLKYLDLSFNQLQFIMKSSFPENVVNRLEVLLLNGNKFMCTCDNLWFVMWINQTTVNIPRLATDVTCAAPGAQKGHSVLFIDLHTCQLNSLSIILHILSTSIILCLLVISISSHLFYWDVWYSYHFCAAKLKGYQTLSSQNSSYDAYIVYDKKDSAVSDWVLNELRVHMEDKGDTCFQLCLDERDWIPGLPIIDNLSQSIQQSRKTVFVLTNTFLSSGNFKTAFYLAHQLLMDDKSDVIILVFLERSLQSSKYLRLRKRLCRGSVLEWPKNPQAQRYFWQCLRNALATENHTQYNKLFRETL